MTLKFFDRLQPLGLFTLRLVLGVIMVAHGYPKVFGGLHRHAAFVASLGIPSWLGYLSSFVELIGGVLLITGWLTRCAAIAVCINMVVAIVEVHWKNGLLGQNGYQFPLSLAAMAFALIFLGGGPLSMDWVLGKGGK